VKHGYTNETTQEGNLVRKVYEGPDAERRAEAEHRALSALAGLIPVPEVVVADPGALTMRLVEGIHGQDLIDLGHAHEVLQACGRILRELHSLDPTLLGASPEADEVIQHGDFGPNNMLLGNHTFDVAAVLDWEFSGVGPAIADIAWCEWIVRMHHPDAVPMLADFFDAYGTRPTWKDRQAEMLRRCRSLTAFAQRWDATGPAVAVWQQRAFSVASWVE
jgi:aminoglycoside phosphotransferase (APT) family kinase protein